MKRSAALVLALSMILTACSQPADNNKENAKKTGKATELYTITMMGEGDSAAVPYAALVKSFEEEHQGIRIKDESTVSTEEWKAQIIEQFASDETTPDVLFYFTGADAKQLILDDEFVSVAEIQAEYPEYAKNIRDSAMNFVREFDGEYYSVPVRGFWEGLFCNKDLFDRYNLALPTDWDSLTRAITVFAENGIVPIAASLGEIPHYWIEHSILAEAGAVEHSLNPSGYVPASWVRGLNSLKDLYNIKAFPEDTLTMSNADATALFMDKKAAMILDGSWTAITDKDNTVVLPVPKTTTGKKDNTDIISGFTSGFYITRKAWNDKNNRDAAVQFVLHMTKDENIAYLCEFGGAPAADIPPSGTATVFEESVSVLQENGKTAIMPIDSRLSKEAWKYLCQQIPQIMLGNISPEDVVTELSKVNKW